MASSTRKADEHHGAAATEGLGRRDRGKLEKYRRITESARAVFREKGFDAATTREIADRADIAIATLFVYAKDKRDLLFMLINDELDGILSKQFKTQPKSDALLSRVVHIFACQYQYLVTDIMLSRAAMRESFAFEKENEDDGPQVKRWRERHRRGLDYLTKLIEEEKKAGGVRADVAPPLVAWLIVSVYRAQTLRWLSEENPTAKKGIKDLEEVMGLLVNGIV